MSSTRQALLREGKCSLDRKNEGSAPQERRQQADSREADIRALRRVPHYRRAEIGERGREGRCVVLRGVDGREENLREDRK